MFQEFYAEKSDLSGITFLLIRTWTYIKYGKEKKNKEENYLSDCNVDLYSLLCGHFAHVYIWVSLHRAKPDNQPKVFIKRRILFQGVGEKE